MKNNILAGGLDRVDTAIDRLIAEKLEAMDEKRGLWANIHAKRKRGERAAKPGEKGYPKTLNIEASAVDRIDARFKKLSGRSMGDAAKEHGAEAERLQKEIDAQTAENERRKAAMKTEEVEEIDEVMGMYTHYVVKHPKTDKIVHHEVESNTSGNSEMENRSILRKQYPGHKVISMDHKNKKLDPNMVKEEVEELDELSKTTLASYAKKGVSDARFKQGIGKDYEAVGKRKRDPNIKAMYARMGQKLRIKAKGREGGVVKAIDRLAKEEVEELDEVSKSKLGGYVRKAMDDEQQTRKQADAAGKSSKEAGKDFMKDRQDVLTRQADKRKTGIDRAITKLSKENVDEADELRARGGLAEGMQQALRKYVPGYAKRELDKKMDAQAYEKGDSTKKTVDKDVNFGRYKRIADKLKNEEIELDEVSKKTLGSYVNKASVDMANRTAEGERKRTLAGADYAHNISRGLSAKTADADMKKDYAAAKPDVKKSVKRMYGISKAVGRLTKEEIKNDLPFKSDSKSNKPIAKPGRFGIGPSTAKHLAQMAMQKQIDKKSKPVTEDEQRMSRAAKGHEKYGKVGMQALAKAGRDGASEKTLDKIRTRHNKYNENLDEAGRMRGGGKDPCWTGYKMVGTKKKAGREVPNCVPTEDRQELKTFKALREELNGN